MRTDPPATLSIAVTVNGKQIVRTVAARLTLADFLRDELGLTGTHLGCEHGVCGACTVFVEGRSARASELQELLLQIFARRAGGCDPPPSGFF